MRFSIFPFHKKVCESEVRFAFAAALIHLANCVHKANSGSAQLLRLLILLIIRPQCEVFTLIQLSSLSVMLGKSVCICGFNQDRMTGEPVFISFPFCFQEISRMQRTHDDPDRSAAIVAIRSDTCSVLDRMIPATNPFSNCSSARAIPAACAKGKESFYFFCLCRRGRSVSQ